jgi:hypothetical protein
MRYHSLLLHAPHSQVAPHQDYSCHRAVDDHHLSLFSLPDALYDGFNPLLHRESILIGLFHFNQLICILQSQLQVVLPIEDLQDASQYLNGLCLKEQSLSHILLSHNLMQFHCGLHLLDVILTVGYHELLIVQEHVVLSLPDRLLFDELFVVLQVLLDIDLQVQLSEDDLLIEAGDFLDEGSLLNLGEQVVSVYDLQLFGAYFNHVLELIELLTTYGYIEGEGENLSCVFTLVVNIDLEELVEKVLQFTDS